MRLLFTLGALPFILFSSCNRGLIQGESAPESLYVIHPSADWPVSKDAVQADALLSEGIKRVAEQNNEDYQAALERFFKPAMRACSECPRARAWLAISYLRLIEQTPRDAATFAAIRALVGPAPGGEVPEETVVARAEWLRLLGRYDEERRLLDQAFASRPSPEIALQRSLAYEDSSMPVPAEVVMPDRLDPRLSYREFARSLSSESSTRLKREAPKFIPGRLALATAALRANNPGYALELLKGLTSLTVVQEGEARSLEAHALAGTGKVEAALSLTEATESPELQGLRRDLLAKLPATKEVYSALQSAANWASLSRYDEERRELVRAGMLGKSDAELSVLEGESFLAENSFGEAENRFLKALSRTKGVNARAAYGLARARLGLREPGAAEYLRGARREWVLGAQLRLMGAPSDVVGEHFAKAQAAGTHEAAAFTEFGRAAEAAKNLELAEFYYALALRYDSHDQGALEGLASARFELGSPSEAVSFLMEKLAQNPDSTGTEVAVAILYLRAGDQVAGKAHLQNSIRHNSRYARAFLLLGQLVKSEGDRQTDSSARRHSYRYALASFEMASKLNPYDPEPYLQTAELYFDLRDLGAAAKNYYRVAELAPHYPHVHFRLAQIARNGGDGLRARELLAEELKVNPYSDEAHVEIGNILMTAKDFMPALHEFQEAVKVNPASVDGLFGAAVSHHLKGEYDEALSLFARTLRLDPLKVDCYWQQGLIYQQLHDSRKAAQAYKSYKEVVRDPAAQAHADRKIREVTGFSPPLEPAFDAFREPPPSLLEVLHARVMRSQQGGWNMKAGREIASAQNRFANQYAELELPSGWACEPKDADSICQSTDPTKRGLAFLVISAKPKSAGVDELSGYLNELSQERAYQTSSGELVRSKPRFARYTDIQGHLWVEALQEGAEMPDFFSLFYSTNESDLSVMISFHVRKDLYREYAASLATLEKSLRVFRKSGDGSGTMSASANPLPLKVVVSRSLENLSPDSRALVAKLYREAEEALVAKNYSSVKGAVSRLLGLVNHYKDAEYLERSAERKLAEVTSPVLPMPAVAALEKQGNLLARRLRKAAVRDELRNLSVSVLKLDPANASAIEWSKKIKEADKRSRSPASLNK